MASSDMAGIDPWTFRPSFIDPWFSEALSRDTQTLTRALTKSLSGNSSSDFFSAADGLLPDLFSPIFAKPEPPTTPAASNVSGGSEPEPAATNKRQRGSVPASGKVSKRKPRASKRSQTTFITADPANFRQMVQQVTGVRFGGGGGCLPMQAGGGIMKPEPQRLGGGRFTGGIIPNGCLPTLDTSAFLLNHDQSNSLQQQSQQQQIDVGGGPAAPPSTGGDAAHLSYVAMAAGGGDFESFASFPTLESWNAM